MRKLPIGIQSFEKLRDEGFLYVDKTEQIYQLIHSGVPFFLSRPRRFGKSLLLSTMKAYFEGRRELFSGLRIEELEKENPDAWQKYPVFYFDFNKKNYMQDSALEEVLADHLWGWEKIYGEDLPGTPLEERFQHLIVRAVEKTGKKAVVLVDEYDKPLLETMTKPELEEHNRVVFKGFFSTLKSYDEYLKFVFLTGVTKFSKVSIFSDLNQLRDISISADYATICGITQEELQKNLMPEVEVMASRNGFTPEECLIRLKKTYDGYHFHHEAEGVYNPFSLINALAEREFGSYWFESGTPTFLIKKLEHSGFDPREITEGRLYATAGTLLDYQYENPDPLPLFYQTGYLTIRGYDADFRSYELGYPNEEVKYGLLESLAPFFLRDDEHRNPLDIRSFGRDLRAADLDSLRDRLIALLARIPYPPDETVVERDFQNVIYIVFMLLGQFVQTEVHSSKGRADCIVEMREYIYLFEFKRDASAEEALRQIEEKGYAKPYVSDPRKLFRIGVNFDSRERTITEWKVEDE